MWCRHLSAVYSSADYFVTASWGAIILRDPLVWYVQISSVCSSVDCFATVVRATAIMVHQQYIGRHSAVCNFCIQRGGRGLLLHLCLQSFLLSKMMTPLVLPSGRQGRRRASTRRAVAEHRQLSERRAIRGHKKSACPAQSTRARTSTDSILDPFRTAVPIWGQTT